MSCEEFEDTDIHVDTVYYLQDVVLNLQEFSGMMDRIESLLEKVLLKL